METYTRIISFKGDVLSVTFKYYTDQAKVCQVNFINGERRHHFTDDYITELEVWLLDNEGEWMNDVN